MLDGELTQFHAVFLHVLIVVPTILSSNGPSVQNPCGRVRTRMGPLCTHGDDPPFQGCEFLAVILDLVEAPPADKEDNPVIPRFTSDVWGHRGIATPATRLINVAHSRAKAKLIYVANVQYHREHSNEQHVLMKFINDGIASGRIASHELWQ